MQGDPRYKSGTSLEKTDKEDARDCIIDLLDINDIEQEILEKDLPKMSVKSLKILIKQLRELIDESRIANLPKKSKK